MCARVSSTRLQAVLSYSQEKLRFPQSSEAVISRWTVQPGNGNLLLLRKGKEEKKKSVQGEVEGPIAGVDPVQVAESRGMVAMPLRCQVELSPSALWMEAESSGAPR